MSAKPRTISPESGLEPRFHIVDADFEITSDGTVLVTGYEERHGQLIPAMFATVTPANLIRMAAKATRVGAEAINVKVFQTFFEADDTSH